MVKASVCQSAQTSPLERMGTRASCPQEAVKVVEAPNPNKNGRQDAHIPDTEAPAPCHKGWYSRGYLPHLDAPGNIQFVTFRLHDSVPLSLIAQWKDELKLSPDLPASDLRLLKLYQHIAAYEDVGYGACWMRDPAIAAIVQEALFHFDGLRYCLLEWCVMPNHVHALIQTLEGYPLTAIIHSWKSFSANAANKRLKRKGDFWMPDFFDRFIRNEEHLHQAREYIRTNPLKANLCQSTETYPFGSAYGNA